MRELIDRQTALQLVTKHIGIDGDTATLLDAGKLFGEISFMPTIMKISDERYQRLIGKKVRA